MSKSTKISWCDASWNPVRGCTKVSAGCMNCYAERFSERFRGLKGNPFEQGFDVRLVPEALDLPRRWRKPRRIFVNSMSDLFHYDVPDEFILSVFDVIRSCQDHTFMILTKRPHRMSDFCRRLRHDAGSITTGRSGGLWLVDGPSTGDVIRHSCYPDNFGFSKLLDNLWLGVSCEDQATSDERIPLLLQTPAAHRFVSIEPLLEPIDLQQLNDGSWYDREGAQCYDALNGTAYYRDGEHGLGGGPSMNWVIVGGESGPKARQCCVEWIRSIVQQCKNSEVPCFVKQVGSNYCDARNGTGGRLTEQPDPYIVPQFRRIVDYSGSDPSEWPEDLRVQEFPEVLR